MKRKKKKLNLLKLVVFLLFIYLLINIISYCLDIKTKNIVILNNNYYTDEQIIETAKIENYPKFFVLSRSKIKKRLSNLELIDSVEVHKKYGFILEIEITEKKALYYNKKDNKYMCSDGNYYTFNSLEGVPTLINFVPNKIEKEFVKVFKNIDRDIISKISEIEYSKSSYDDYRFLMYMNDGNMVYINTKKMSSLNKYVDIVTKLDNKKGILYLDSGNYLEIKE